MTKQNQNIEKQPIIEVRASKTAEWDDTFSLMSWWKKDTVRKAKVMVVGAGALGNEVIKNLALLGIGHILLVDYDTIEYSNLSRSVLFREEDCGRKKGVVAIERLKQINPAIKAQYLDGNITTDIGLGIFRYVDVVIGCLDNRLARLSINRFCHKVNTTWVDGGIQDLGGNAFVFKPGKTCYECLLSSRDKKLLEHKLSCLDVAIQHTNLGRIPTTPISSSIIAAVQVQEALKVVNKEREEVQMLEEYFYYEGRSNTVLQRQYPKLKDHCPSHYRYDPIIISPLSAHITVDVALHWLSTFFGEDDPQIVLDQVLVLEVTSRKSEQTTKLPNPIPKSKINNQFIKQYTQHPGEELMLTKIMTQLDKSFDYQHMRLSECGIPELHIIRVLTDEGEHYVELSLDETYINFK